MVKVGTHKYIFYLLAYKSNIAHKKIIHKYGLANIFS